MWCHGRPLGSYYWNKCACVCAGMWRVSGAEAGCSESQERTRWGRGGVCLKSKGVLHQAQNNISALMSRCDHVTNTKLQQKSPVVHLYTHGHASTRNETSGYFHVNCRKVLLFLILCSPIPHTVLVTHNDMLNTTHIFVFTLKKLNGTHGHMWFTRSPALKYNKSNKMQFCQ